MAREQYDFTEDIEEVFAKEIADMASSNAQNA
jgi:hypothetical protein